MTERPELMELLRKERRRSLLASLTNLRDEKCLTDVTLVVDGYAFAAHRLMLAASSYYFRDMLRHKPKATKINISDVDVDVFATVLNYFYTGHLMGPAATPAKMNSVLATLKSLKVVNYHKVGNECLLRMLSVDSFYKTWYLARQMDQKDTERQIANYVATHLERCCKTPNFTKLKLQQVIAVLTSPVVKSKSSCAIMEAVLAWCDHTPDQRQKYLSTLLSLVGMRSYATKCQNSNFPIGGEVITRSLPVAIPSEPQSPKSWPCSPMSTPRLCRMSPPTAITRDSGDSSTPASFVSSEMNEEMPTPRTATGQLELVGKGEEESNVSDDDNAFSYEIFDAVREHQRTSMPSPALTKKMLTNKTTCIPTDTSCVLCFGLDVYGLPIMACYDLDRQFWMPSKETIHLPFLHVTTFLHDRSVYFFGGELRLSGVAQSSAYVHLLDQQVLRQLTSMRVARSRIGVACFKDELYAIGGVDSKGELVSAVEKYNPERDSWETMASLLYPRCQPSATVTKREIYVVGGFLDTANLKVCPKCEYYDPAFNEWHEICPLPESLSSFPVTVTTVANSVHLLRLVKPDKLYRYDERDRQWVVGRGCKNAILRVSSLMSSGRDDGLWVLDRDKALVRLKTDTGKWQTVTQLPTGVYPPVQAFIVDKI